MKKKLSRLWSLTLVLAVLAGLLVIPVGAAWSLPPYTILSPGELTEIRAGGLADANMKLVVPFQYEDGKRFHTEDTATLGEGYNSYSIWRVNLLPGASGKVVYGILVEKGLGDILLRVTCSDKNQDVWVRLTPCA